MKRNQGESIMFIKILYDGLNGMLNKIKNSQPKTF